MATHILEGIRVLDFGRYIAAPYCAALLGSLGAEVIRIESPEGNDDRYVMPISETFGAMYLQANQNKSSLPIDLRHPRASELVKRLVRHADVVVANMVPKSLKRLGLDYATLKSIKDDIIVTNITAYGASGPQRDVIGFDGTGQAMSGAIHLSGWEDQPFRAAVSYVDYGTAFASAFATLAAIYGRSRTGTGQEVQASLLGTALTMMNPILMEEASGERSRSPIGNRSPIAGPSDIFRTADQWIIVQVIGQQMFERWAEIVGAPHLVSDPRFSDDIGRGECGEVLSEFMSNWCRTRSSAECMRILRSAQLPCSPVLTPADALKESQVLQGGLVGWRHVDGLQREIPFAAPFTLSHNPAMQATAPMLRQGARASLKRSGFSDAEIDDLGRSGVVTLDEDPQLAIVAT